MADFTDGDRSWIRWDGPTIVCVVGEFKQGKSSLVNALIGADLCPVDDDMATSVLTLVHHGETPSITVRRSEAGEPKVETIDPSTIRDWVTEAGNPGNERGVERIDIAAPSPFLAEGVAIVDTPGAGGIPNSVPAGFTVTEDTVSEGYEFEFSALPARNWRVTFNASRTEATRRNVGGVALAEFINGYETALKTTPAGDLRIWWGGAGNVAG